MKTRRRSSTALALALSAAFVLGACGSTATTTSGTDGTSGTGPSAAGVPGAGGGLPVGGAVEIKIVNSPYGPALGRGNGKVLYAWDKETDGTTICSDAACVEKWPPLTATAMSFGAGVDRAKFALVDRPDGTKQVAIGGRRLYTMAIDTPGEANCQGSEGWWILNPDGSKNTSTEPITKNTTPSTDASGTTGPTTTAFRVTTSTTTVKGAAPGKAPTPTTAPTTAPTTKASGY
jgi:predicted lipoprotein with Yx(FWY)xxD motif